MDKNEVRKYKQPEWCTYPDASKPFWGCWSLLDGKVKDENFCLTCECHKNYGMYRDYFWKQWTADKKEMKDALVEFFSDDNLQKMAENAYPVNAVQKSDFFEDINDDARYYYLRGLKDLKNMFFEKF